jgi:hypothetical protein
MTAYMFFIDAYMETDGALIVNTVMNLNFQKNCVICWLNERMLEYQEQLCSL